MNWLILRIVLKHKQAWPFGILGIILHNYRLPDPGDYIAHKNIILSQLIIPMRGYSDLSPFD
jgi:hypothetical protein